MNYQILQRKIKDTAKAKRGRGIFYKCEKCGEMIYSVPKDNIGCKCGNVFIDVNYGRLAIDDYSKFIVLKEDDFK